MRALAIVFAVLVLLAPPLLAEEAETADEVTVEQWEETLAQSPTTRWALVLLKVVPTLLGVLFLFSAYRGWNRRKAGWGGAEDRDRLLAVFGEGEPLGEPRAGPTVPYPLGVAFLLTVFAVVLGLAAAPLVANLLPGGRDTLVFRVVLVLLVEAPIAAVVLVRRHRLRAGRITAPARALGRGVVTFSIGSAVAFPLALLGGAVLLGLGKPPEVQQVLLEATDKASPANLWIIAAFGVLAAPVLEESIFRGLFFPALRQASGGGRRGFWLSAILVSLLFATVHENLYALLPLFGLAIVLTVVFEKTDSLSTVILGHAFYNASTVVPMLIARMEGAI